MCESGQVSQKASVTEGKCHRMQASQKASATVGKCHNRQVWEHTTYGDRPCSNVMRRHARCLLSPRSTLKAWCSSMFFLQSLPVSATNLKNETNLVVSKQKKCQEEESRIKIDNWDKLTMISLLKVYQTLYQSDKQKILLLLIVISKSSNNFYKHIRLSYS